MAKTKGAFPTEFKGYKKDEVDEYIKALLLTNRNASAEIQSQNEQIEALKSEVLSLNRKLDDTKNELDTIEGSFHKIEEDYSTIKKENEEVKEQLDQSLAAYDKLFKKYNKIHNDEERVARILLDTQKHAENVMNEATAEALNEKARLDRESEGVKRDIIEMICDIRELGASAKESAMELVSVFKTQTEELEKMICRKVDALDEATEELIVAKIQSAGLDADLTSDEAVDEDVAEIIEQEENI